MPIEYPWGLGRPRGLVGPPELQWATATATAVGPWGLGAARASMAAPPAEVLGGASAECQ